MSRPGFSGGLPPRFSTTTVLTLSPRSSSAASTICFSATGLPLREVASVQKTALQPARLIRSPNAPEPKPAKTTRWIAPIRAQASMVTIASGQVGM